HTPPACIVFLGDGLTEHFDLSVFARNDVVNRGIIGDFTKSMNTRLEEIVQASPSKVFIMAGINDIREKLPLFLIKRHLKCMVETIREKSPGTQIYIQSILPIPVRYNFIDPDHHINKVILRMNKKMEKLCQQQNIKFIDLYPHFERDGELNPLFKDEFHGINREGYLLWIELIRPYVEK
ncbi:MAG: GDSL-type esterase/lipase family protein, partial [Flavobacteriales bacterium]